MCIEHPLSKSIALPCIIVFLHSYQVVFSYLKETTGIGYSKLPYIRTRDMLTKIASQLIVPNEFDEYSLLLRRAKPEVEKENVLFHANELLTNPYEDDCNLGTLVQKFTDTIRAEELLEELCCSRNKDIFDAPDCVKRLRLNGNFSKLHLLKCALTGVDTSLLNLQYCSELDEELLDVILFYLKNVKVVWLKGTCIDKNSKIVRKFSQRGKGKRFIKFDFTGEICKCCGHEPEKEFVRKIRKKRQMLEKIDISAESVKRHKINNNEEGKCKKNNEKNSAFSCIIS